MAAARRERKSLPLPGPAAAWGGPFRCVAWHPRRPLLALATDQVVALYDTRRQAWLPMRLRNDLMLGITRLEWSPLAEMLAVACARGVCLWRFLGDLRPPEEGGALDGGAGGSGGAAAAAAAWMGFLQQPAAAPTVAMAWSHHGRLLATVAEGDPRVLIWDVALRTFTPLHTASSGAPLCLAWSPDGRFLLAAFDLGGFGIWETQRWTFASWEFPGQCRAVAWSPDSQRLALVMNDMRPNDQVWYRSDEAPDDGPWVRGTLAEFRGPDACLVLPGGGSAADAADPAAAGAAVERALADLVVDKPVFIGTVQEREDAPGDFNVDFDCAYLPPPDLNAAAAAAGVPPLCGGLAHHLEWAPDGGTLLVAFECPAEAEPDPATGLPGLPGDGDSSLSAICAFSVTARRDALNFALTQVLDLRRTRQGAAATVRCWPRVLKKLVAAATVWGDSRDLAADREEAPHLALLSLPACGAAGIAAPSLS